MKKKTILLFALLPILCSCSKKTTTNTNESKPINTIQVNTPHTVNLREMTVYCMSGHFHLDNFSFSEGIATFTGTFFWNEKCEVLSLYYHINDSSIKSEAYSECKFLSSTASLEPNKEIYTTISYELSKDVQDHRNIKDEKCMDSFYLDFGMGKVDVEKGGYVPTNDGLFCWSTVHNGYTIGESKKTD